MLVHSSHFVGVHEFTAGVPSASIQHKLVGGQWYCMVQLPTADISDAPGEKWHKEPPTGGSLQMTKFSLALFDVVQGSLPERFTSSG